MVGPSVACVSRVAERKISFNSCGQVFNIIMLVERGSGILLGNIDLKEGVRRKQRTPVEEAKVSDSAKRKSDTKKASKGFCVHSFPTLMEDLGTLSLNKETPLGEKGEVESAKRVKGLLRARETGEACEGTEGNKRM